MRISLKNKICSYVQQYQCCTAYGHLLNVQTKMNKASERGNTMRKNCEMENNGKHVRENERMRDKERATEM